MKRSFISKSVVLPTSHLNTLYVFQNCNIVIFFKPLVQKMYMKCTWISRMKEDIQTIPRIWWVNISIITTLLISKRSREMVEYIEENLLCPTERWRKKKV